MFRKSVFALRFQLSRAFMKSAHEVIFPAKRYLRPKRLTPMNLRQGDPSGSKQHNEVVRLTESSDAAFPFFHPTWVQDICGETRVGWLFTCAIAWWYFYRSQACFHFVYHALLLLSHCFPFQTPHTHTSASRRQGFSFRFSGTFRSSVKNCHRLKDSLSRHHPLQHRKVVYFPHQLIHYMFIQSCGWMELFQLKKY